MNQILTIIAFSVKLIRTYGSVLVMVQVQTQKAVQNVRTPSMRITRIKCSTRSIAFAAKVQENVANNRVECHVALAKISISISSLV